MQKDTLNVRSALVTGASGGLGLAISTTLAHDGFGLTICARREAPLLEARDRFRYMGVEVNAIVADVANESDLCRVIASHSSKFGSLDVLVNNAGVTAGSSIVDEQTDSIDSQIDINIRAVIIAYREAVPLLTAAAAARGQAWAINISSISGLRGQPFRGTYSATKHAVVGFTEAMNKELGHLGIKSTVICPAVVDTDMTAFWRDQIERDDMIQPNDIAGAVRWLISTSPSCVVPQIAITLPGDEVRPSHVKIPQDNRPE